MKLPFKNILLYAVPAAVIVGLIGCIQIKVTTVNSAKPQAAADGMPHDGGTPPDRGGRGTIKIDTNPPTVIAGSINVPIGLLQTGNNSQGCFQNPPWDRFYIVVTNFPGPNSTPDAFSFINVNHSTNLTVKTCNPANGTTLETGIVIFQQFNTNEKQCVTNSLSCLDNPNLTINQFLMTNVTKKYRAVVHYKSSTLTNLTAIQVDFSYP